MQVLRQALLERSLCPSGDGVCLEGNGSSPRSAGRRCVWMSLQYFCCSLSFLTTVRHPWVHSQTKNGWQRKSQGIAKWTATRNYVFVLDMYLANDHVEFLEWRNETQFRIWLSKKCFIHFMIDEKRAKIKIILQSVLLSRQRPNAYITHNATWPLTTQLFCDRST